MLLSDTCSHLILQMVTWRGELTCSKLLCKLVPYLRLKLGALIDLFKKPGLFFPVFKVCVGNCLCVFCVCVWTGSVSVKRNGGSEKLD